MDRWSRRQLVQGVGVAGLGLLVGCGRLPGQAQPPPRPARIGWLSPGLSMRLESDGNRTAFLDGMRELGWVDGQNLSLEARYAENQLDRLPTLAAELVQLQVDLVVAVGTSVYAAKDATGTIPIITSVATDPVGSGIVASFARPGGNVTGLSELAPELAGKRVELLRAAAGETTHVAVLWQRNAVGDVPPMYTATQVAAETLGIELQSLEVGGAGDVDPALEIAARDSAALLILPVPLLSPAAYGPRIVDFAIRNRLPSMSADRRLVDSGGLMAYGPRTTALYRRLAAYADKILKGAKPADLPVEQPMTLDFVINLKTAQALGLAIPQDVLLQATEVIQ